MPVRGRLFWPALIVAVYPYAGYPVLLQLLAWLCRRRRPLLPAAELPAARVIVAAYNEEETIAYLLRSCATARYPRGRLALTVVLDSCTDATAAVVEGVRPELEDAGVALTVLANARRSGKGPSLVHAVAGSTEPLLVFTDANAVLDPDAVQALGRRFDDVAVGGVAGRRRPQTGQSRLPALGDGLYWRYEAMIKRHEGALASVAGVDGALYALRRDLFVAPRGCTDDLEISLAVMAAGYRVVYAPDAVAYESAAPRLTHEFRRKLRTQSCALLAFWRFRGLLSPRRPLLAWILCSHKLARYLVPYAAFLLVLAASRPPRTRRGRAALAVAGAGAAAALAVPARPGSRRHRLRGVVLYGLLAQAAAALAPFVARRGRNQTWRPTPR